MTDVEVDWASGKGIVEEKFGPKENKKFDEPLFKKWFKAGGNSGFISITPWYDAQKVTIDIGAVNPNSNEIKSSTKCFVDMVDLLVYLRAIISNQAADLYPKRSQCPSRESFVAFGGSGELSRVFKIHWWGAKEDTEGNASGFAWKCGHFGGTVGDNGQIAPNWNDRKSADMIKVSRLEMHEIATRLEYALTKVALSAEGITA